MGSVDATLASITERELEILRLLDKGMSDREIADLLYLAPGTVKWHNNQIYTKLGVNRRSQAVARARDLGLLTMKPAEAPGSAAARQERPRALTSSALWPAYLKRIRSHTSRREGLLVLASVSVAAIITVIVFLKPPVELHLARPNVLAGVEGGPQDTDPTEAEIKLARQRMGEEGFIAYIACTQASEYQITQAREMRDLARSYGLDLRIYDSEPMATNRLRWWSAPASRGQLA